MNNNRLFSTKLEEKKILNKGFYRNVYVIDCKGQNFRNIFNNIINIIIGKNNIFLLNKSKIRIWKRSNLDFGNYVKLINYNEIIDIKKLKKKNFFMHSGYGGGLKKINKYNLFYKNKKKFFMKTIQGMLPKNRTNKFRLKRLIFD